MSSLALILVLSSALIHALWNLIVKTVGGGPVFVWLFTVLYSALLIPASLVMLLTQPQAVTPLGVLFVGGTSLLHLCYFLALQQGYQTGDLSLVYPIARGLGPALATVGAIVLLQERPSTLVLCGLALVVLGVVLLAFRRHEPLNTGKKGGVFYGVMTGILISMYTVWDKYAVSQLHVPPLVLQAFSGLGISLMLAPHALRRWDRVTTIWKRQRRAVVAVAILSPASYFLVLLAMTFTPLSYIAPTREISILFAAFLGSRFLGEGDTLRRTLAACSMVGGVVALAVG